MSRTFKPIQEWDEGYEYYINAYGVVKNSKLKDIKPKKDNKGYWYVKLTNKRDRTKRIYRYISRLIAQVYYNWGITFSRKQQQNLVVVFIDGNRDNYRLDNLLVLSRDDINKPKGERNIYYGRDE